MQKKRTILQKSKVIKLLVKTPTTAKFTRDEITLSGIVETQYLASPGRREISGKE
jgi:hypothetical protein